MAWWGRSQPQNQAANLRNQQINDLKKNPSVVTVTENSLYECRFKTRMGTQSFLIELPPAFPNVAPILKFRSPMNHQLIPGPEKMFIRSSKLASWGPHTSINGVIQECLVKFVSAPPQPAQANQPPPPSFNQYQQHQQMGPSGYRPPVQYNQAPRPMGGYQQPMQQQPVGPGGYRPPQQYNQARPPMGAPGYQPPPQQMQHPGVQRPSTQSNASANSAAAEPEEDIAKLDFQAPADFEMLQHFDRNALKQVLDNEQSLKDLAVDCAEHKQARSILLDTRTALRESTEVNLKSEPDINREQQRLESARAEVAALTHEYDTFKKREERCMQKYSKSCIEAEFDQLIVEVTDELAQLKEQFENDEVKVVKYVNQYYKLKKLSHLRQIKKSRTTSLNF